MTFDELLTVFIRAAIKSGATTYAEGLRQIENNCRALGVLNCLDSGHRRWAAHMLNTLSGGAINQ